MNATAKFQFNLMIGLADVWKPLSVVGQRDRGMNEWTRPILCPPSIPLWGDKNSIGFNHYPVQYSGRGPAIMSSRDDLVPWDVTRANWSTPEQFR